MSDGLKNPVCTMTEHGQVVGVDARPCGAREPPNVKNTGADLARWGLGRPDAPCPIQLRVFGAKDDSATPLLERVNVALAAAAGEVDAARLEVGAADGTVTVAWAPAKWYTGADLCGELERVRRVLGGMFEAHWSSAPGRDRRAEGEFTFAHADGERADGEGWDAGAAQAFCRALCERHGHAVLAAECESAAEAAGGTVTVRFRAPASVGALCAALDGADVRFGASRVTFAPSRRALPLDAPAAIARPHQGVAAAHLLAELQGWVHAYNAAHGAAEYLAETDGMRGRVQGAHFVATPSSVPLAAFLCAQTPLCGHAYEFVYALNARDLVPRLEAEKRAEEERDAQAAQTRESLAQLHRVLDSSMAKTTEALRGMKRDIIGPRPRRPPARYL